MEKKREEDKKRKKKRTPGSIATAGLAQWQALPPPKALGPHNGVCLALFGFLPAPIPAALVRPTLDVAEEGLYSGWTYSVLHTAPRRIIGLTVIEHLHRTLQNTIPS